MSQIEIEIDGQKIKTEAGKMLIQVADEAGIYIPRYCYHKKLSVAANCRMCLVEVDKAPKTLPACATFVADGMKVFTQSKKTLESQRAVMEFLLLNHPLDCPICDQGGQCELQDVAMGYGNDASDYGEGKRSVKNENLGPFIATEMTRCIHCTRCVRFGQEVAGVREIGATGRGEHTQIGTYVQHTVSHEMSGNIIDLCPVGALMSKPFLYSARSWELTQHSTIAPHDCVGSNVSVHTRREDVMRVVPRENDSLNETWISDRDRFSYEGLKQDRLTKPIIRDGEKWREVSWPVALNYVAEALGKIKTHDGADKIGALLSPSSTTEEAFLLQKLLRGMGVNNIDHRLRQTDFSDQEHDPSHLGLTISFDELEKQSSILLIGSNIRREQPIIAHRIRKASLAGAKVMCINMVDYQFNFPLAQKLIALPSQFKVQLGKVLKACLDLGCKADLKERTLKWLDSHVEVDEASIEIAKNLLAEGDSTILLGAMAGHYLKSSSIRYLAQMIAEMTGASLGLLTEGANSAGCRLAGALPHRGVAGSKQENVGLSVREMLQQHLSAYWLHGIEPLLDIANPTLIREALNSAKLVVAVTAFDSSQLRKYAHVMLPMCAQTETSGTFVNVTQTAQSFTGVVKPHGEARPGWKIYRVLGNVLELEGFDYESTADVQDEINNHLENFQPMVMAYPEPESIDYQFNEGLELIAEVPMYAIDPIVRRSSALQEMQALDNPSAIRMNLVTSKHLNMHSGQEILVQQINEWQKCKVAIDPRIPDHAVYMSVAVDDTSPLGDMFGLVKLKNG